MAISFGSAPGDLFAALGKVAALLKNARTNQDLQHTALTSQATGVVGQLNDEPDVQAIAGAGYVGALDSIGSSVGALAAQVADAIANRYVYRDLPRVNQTLTQSDTLQSLQEIVRQMKEQGASVRACAVTAGAATFSGKGNGVLVVSTKRPFDGRTLENAFTETAKVVCTADGYVGGATAGRETFEVRGAGRRDDVFAFDWPQGSGATATLTAIDNSQDSAGGSSLTNGGFDDWTDGLPDNWDVTEGEALVTQDTGVLYGGGSSLAFTGDGSTNLKIRQVFGDGTLGTASTLSALTQHSVALWLQRDGVLSSAGTLRVSLADSGGTVVKDADGQDNSFEVDLTGLPTLFQAHTGVFRLPLIVPDELYIQIETTAPYDNGRTFYIDHAGLAEMTQHYTGGPYYNVHSGHEPFQVNDLFLETITNGRGAGGTLDTFQTAFYRLFPDAASEELLLPSGSSPSILDALIG